MSSMFRGPKGGAWTHWWKLEGDRMLYVGLGGGDLGSHSTLGSLPLLHQNPLESLQNTTDAWA